MKPAAVLLLGFCCVAPLYVLYSIQHDSSFYFTVMLGIDAWNGIIKIYCFVKEKTAGCTFVYPPLFF